jgi:hypothetical protein
MNPKEYLTTETLELAFFSGLNPLRARPERVDALLEQIETRAPAFLPQEAALGGRTVGYSRASVGALLRGKASSPKTILTLSRSDRPASFYTLSFVQPGWEVEFWLRLVVPFGYLSDPTTANSAASQLVDLVVGLDSVCPCIYGYAHPKSDLSLGTDPHRDDPSAPKLVYEMYWLNAYGVSMVARLGRDRVLATPAAKIEPLPSGGILLLTQPTPANATSETARRAQASALAHLREDISIGAALERLEQRSSTLSPVTRDWDPDIADLLELILTTHGLGDQQLETRRLNDYRPPPVSEWRSLDDLKAAGVGDSGSAIARYADLSEQFVALLKRDLPSLQPFDPASLPEIDFYVWQTDYLKSFPERDVIEKLVPAVGGFIGDLLVARLGGRWVPGRHLQDAGVALGDRVWLPFLRARHYLQSKEAALDYSLTQFFREAARHAR